MCHKTHLCFQSTCIHPLRFGSAVAHLVATQQRQHFPSLQLILLYFLIYAPCLGSVDYNYTKKRMASCILCHALIKNLITPLHHSCIQKSRYLEGLTKPSVCFYWAPLICVFRPTLLT